MMNRRESCNYSMYCLEIGDINLNNYCLRCYELDLLYKKSATRIAEEMRDNIDKEILNGQGIPIKIPMSDGMETRFLITYGTPIPTSTYISNNTKVTAEWVIKDDKMES